MSNSQSKLFIIIHNYEYGWIIFDYEYEWIEGILLKICPKCWVLTCTFLLGPYTFPYGIKPLHISLYSVDNHLTHIFPKKFMLFSIPLFLRAFFLIVSYLWLLLTVLFWWGARCCHKLLWEHRPSGLWACSSSRSYATHSACPPTCFSHSHHLLESGLNTCCWMQRAGRL